MATWRAACLGPATPLDGLTYLSRQLDLEHQQDRVRAPRYTSRRQVVVEIAQHIEALRTEGRLLAAAAERATLDTRLPTCPRWRIRGLLRHVGMVHRWAAAHVSGTRNDNFDPFKELIRKWPADAALVASFRDGHAALVGALESAPPDLKCFTFLPAPSALAFWARRQAHETGIHRADAEVPGGAVTPYPAAVARDGIDELLFGFLSRPKSSLTADSPRTLHIHATDTTGEWLLRIGPNGPEIAAEHAAADCTISGTASDLTCWSGTVDLSTA